MKLMQVGALLALAGAASACSSDTNGDVVTLPPLASMRYINLVSDTSAVDIRIVDAVAYAPNTQNATFRSGGFPYGVTLGGNMPTYSPVAAGSHEIRVFLNGGDPATSSTILLDTTFTFAEGFQYTFYTYGFARTGQTPALSAVITTDTVPTIAAGNFALRVLNLAPNVTGNPGGVAGNLDGRVGLTTTATPIPGAATYANMAPGALTAYASFPVSTAGQAYRLQMSGAGAATPIAFQNQLPVGVTGTSTTQPVPGTAVAQTAITAVIVPRSVPGSKAPQTTAASVSTNIDSIVRSNDTVTVWRKITPGNGTTTCNTAVAAGVAANDIINVSGITQPEYNGAQSVINITAGTSQTIDTARQTVTLSGGAAGNTFTLGFGGQTTGALPYDATAASVQAALAGLSTIGGAANVGVTGPIGGPFVVVFKGAFLGTNPVTTMVATPTGGVLTATVAVNFNCLGTATSSRFRYRIAGTPVTPATGAPSYKIVTAGNADFTLPSILYLIDVLPPRTAP